MKKGISVIICCYNSERRLPETLRNLLQQNISGFDWEIILVDNKSTDATAILSRQILSKNLPAEKFNIVTEQQSGLSNARRKGYLASQYSYLLFCDDDNWLSEKYMQVAFEVMEQYKNIGILGGKGEAVFEKVKPNWFDEYQSNFAVGPQSSGESEISFTDTVYGAGFVVRKEVFQTLDKIGFYSLLSDRKGSDLMSGGDTELCYVTKYIGYEIVYCDKLQFKHLMTKERLKWDYLKKLYYGFGKMRLYTHAYKLLEKTNEIPGENLRLSLWLDKYLHLMREGIFFLPQGACRWNEEGCDSVLKYCAWRGELNELRTLKNNYSKVFANILGMKKRIVEMRNGMKIN